MTYRLFSRRQLAVSLPYLLFNLCASSLFAQELLHDQAVTIAPLEMSEDYRTNTPVDETTVTARKTLLQLIDLPQSVVVIGANELNSKSINSVDLLSRQVPNLFYTQGILDDQIQLRGLGTNGGNQGFEPAVSLVVDNISFSKNRYLRESLFDLERAEILFGPQGLYYGKNTTAGSINLITASPTDHHYIRANLGFESETDQTSQELVLSGPLSESISARFALRNSSSDGWIDSSAPRIASQVPQRDSRTQRLTLSWRGEQLELSAKLSHSEFETIGSTAMPVQCGPDIEFLILVSQSSENCQPDTKRSAGEAIVGGQGSLSQESEEYQSTTFLINASWQFDNFTLSSTSGYTEFETEFGVDADFWDIPLLFTERPEQFDQLSQELRLTSNQNSGYWMLGAYYEESDFTAYGNSDWGFTNAGLIMDASTHRVSTQETSSFALFAEKQFELSEQTSVSVGGRYTRDKKSATHLFNLGSLGNPFDDNPVVALIFSDPTLFGWTETDIEESRVSHNFSPAITLQHRPSETLLFYASYSEGFKAGGFDLGLDSQPDPTSVPEEFEFDDEQVQSVEIGGNAQLLGDRVNIRFAAYHNRYSELQTLNFDGIASFAVGNAASAESTGIELSTSIELLENWVFDLGLALGDHHFTSYPNGPCTIEQALSTPPPCTQNLKDAPLPRAPEKQANFGVVWNGELGETLISIAADARYTGEIQFETDNDPFTLQNSFWKYDAQLTLKQQDSNWTLLLRGMNLSDKTTITSVTDLPLSSGGSYFATIDRPRTVELKIEYLFEGS